MPTRANDPEVARVRHLLASRSSVVIGIDEVGLGALAGPVVVAGVVANVNWFNEFVKDSKKYSKTKKHTAHEKRKWVAENHIKPEVLYYCHIKMRSQDIDTFGIRDAWLRCLWVISTQCLNFYPDAVVVVDGDSTGSVPTPNVVAIPKGDSIVAAVSAASVLAKVERDSVMHIAAGAYPEYGFDKHVGYGTRQHMNALEQHGPCSLHRRSYLPVKKAAEAWQKIKQQENVTSV